MRVAIFENEYASVRGAFETANLLNFNNSLVIKLYASSQKADLSKLNEFDVIFIDIDLSVNSYLDGFGLIKKLNSQNNDILKKIIILTGNNKIKEALKSRNIDSESIQIIIKPTDYEAITKYIENIKSI